MYVSLFLFGWDDFRKIRKDFQLNFLRFEIKSLALKMLLKLKFSLDKIWRLNKILNRL